MNAVVENDGFRCLISPSNQATKRPRNSPADARAAVSTEYTHERDARAVSHQIGEKILKNWPFFMTDALTKHSQQRERVRLITCFASLYSGFLSSCMTKGALRHGRGIKSAGKLALLVMLCIRSTRGLSHIYVVLHVHGLVHSRSCHYHTQGI